MSRNGSGTYSLPAGNPVTTGTQITATWGNTTLSDIATEITNSVAADGQTAITANLPMTGFKHTNIANATARTEYCAAGQAQDNTFDWLTSVSGTDTITASAAIGLSAYAAGQTFRFVSAGANTGTSVTLNINAVGAKSVTKLGSTALAVGDIPSGAVVEVVYDGTRFQIVGLASQHAATADTATTATSATSATSATTATTATNIAGGASGSLPYQSAAATTAMLAKGADGQVLTLAAGVPAWADSESIGIGQTWQDVKTTPGRSLGSTYTNSSGRPIYVYVSCSNSSGGTMTVTVAGLAIATFGLGAAAVAPALPFIVPPGATYSVSNTAGSLLSWYELRA